MQIDKLINSGLEIGSPKKRNAIIVANNGEVLFKKATFDSEINLTAMLNTKKVMVPEHALTITSFH